MCQELILVQSIRKEVGQRPRYGHGRASAGDLSRSLNQFAKCPGPLLRFGRFSPILAMYQRKKPIDLLTCLAPLRSRPRLGCSLGWSGRWEHATASVRAQHRIVCCCGRRPSCCCLCSWRGKNHLRNRHKCLLCFDRFSPILATWEGDQTPSALHPFSLILHA